MNEIVTVGQASRPPALERVAVYAAPLLVAIVGTLLVVNAGVGPSQTDIALVFVYMAFALAWNVVGGYAGQFAFGHAAFFGIGAYASTLLAARAGVPPLFGILVGLVAAALAGAVIGGLTLRLTGLYFGLATVVFPILFARLATYFGLQEVSVPFLPNEGLEYFTPPDPRILSFACVLVATLVALLSVGIERSRLRLLWSAMRSDPPAAESCGIATRRHRLAAFVLSAGLSAVAGSLYAQVVLVVTPEGVFGLTLSVQPVLFALFGGAATVWGPIIGAAALVPLTQWLDATYGASLPGISDFTYGLALLFVVLAFPQGVYWGARRLAPRLRRARRRRPTPAPAPAPHVPAPAPAPGVSVTAPAEPAGDEVVRGRASPSATAG